jgi:phage baseplate assembly protein W
MSKALSDLNPLTGKSIVDSRTRTFSDLDVSFLIHPQKNDIVPLYDLDAIRSSVKTLILSGVNERPFHPELGTALGGLLFEPADTFTAIAIRTEILRVLQEHEPRVNGVTVEVLDYSDDNAYRITVGFNISGRNFTDSVEFYLNRLR